MILLESGPAKTDRYYWLVVGVAFLGFAGWFVYDGLYRYYAKNRATAERELMKWTALPVELGRAPTRQDFEQLKAANPSTRAQVEQALGRPLPPRKEGAASDGALRFASIYGLATVPFESGGAGRVNVPEMTWQDWTHKKEDIDGQLYWAIVPAVGCVYFLFRAYKAARLRAVIDEEGMTYGGVRIAFAEMVSLRDYNPKGWVDLYYRAGPGEKRLRIDNQKIARFDEIAALIAARKGFENPVQAAEAKVAAGEKGGDT